MLRYVSHDIVYQEIPDHITLAINISGCPNGCVGCHSPHLMDDVGQELSFDVLLDLVTCYRSAITCVCFMGGDSDPQRIWELASGIKQLNESLAVAWYSGCSVQVEDMNDRYDCFDYLKFGPYIHELGGLDSKTTNQRLYFKDYRGTSSSWQDITSVFWDNNRFGGSI